MADLTPEEQKVIFVVGNSRSGTTMLSQILGRSVEVYSLLELHFFEELCAPSQLAQALAAPEATALLAQLAARQADPYARFQGDAHAARYQASAESILADTPPPWQPMRLWAAFLQHTARSQGKSIPLEQTPRNVFYIQEILTHFPNAVIIHVVRDARDVILSQKYKWRRFWGQPDTPRRLALLFWANYHPVTMSLMWNSAIQAGDRFQGHPRVLTARFEDVVAQGEVEIGRICAWLAIPWRQEMLEIPSNSSHTPGPAQTVGLQADAAGRWQRAAGERADLALCQHLTQTNLQRHGYPPAASLRPGWLDWARAGATWPLKMGLALLLNFGRTRHLLSAVKQRLTAGRSKSV